MKSYKQHILVVIGFVVVSLLYFYPVLQGKEILQGDIVQYTAMAQEQIDYREQYQTESYWTNGAFGGMPTYQLGAKYPNNFIKDLDSIIRFLPRPADYLFLYLIGFYVLLCSLRVKPTLAFLGSIAFGLSTYLIVIIGAGHNAKAHAIGYMPLVISGVIWVFRKHYIAGGLLTMFAVALEISANHFQMTYYLLFLLAIIGVYYTWCFVKKKELKSLGISFATLLLSATLGVGANATNLMATQEYAQYSNRSKSHLSINPDGSKKNTDNAMSYNYITEYSYGWFETFNLFSSKIMGGGNREDFGKNSELKNFVERLGASESDANNFAQNAPGYWGNQPIVVAPAYIGAVVIFLSILALFVEKRRIKYIFLSGAVLSIILSLGKNIFITDWLIEYFPMYNKFRAIASVQVIAELCLPVLAFMGLSAFAHQTNEEEKSKALRKTTFITAGIIALLLLAIPMLDFKTESDYYLSQAYFGQLDTTFINALIDGRKSLYINDVFRTTVLVAIAAGLLWLGLRNKIKTQYAIILVGILSVVDLFLIDKQYVNQENFVEAHRVKKPFEKTAIDDQILQDKGIYRVFDVNGGFNSAKTSFFHKSLGGYHAAKPKKIQDIYDHLITQGKTEPLNMLNVKYLIIKGENGENDLVQNEYANGNAWFVSQTQVVDSPDEVIGLLGDIDTKNIAIIQTQNKSLQEEFTVEEDAKIQIQSYKSDEIIYQSANANDGMAVFSEVYYPHGWVATIDGKETPITEVNYTLRAIKIPAGQHTIAFRFVPQVVQTGSQIAAVSFGIMMLLLVVGIFFIIKKKRNDEVKN